ncbi:hypothetical protein CGMCC3_g1986 [Colletotrichum fructicola]|nr:uncharacterized protein CGMCC3_g1986 [Colletotrichum fructicola]KAE9581719.1 hypothetical protein CGMCC3_g1986 [Colletotrichum fructicola]
MMAIRTNAPAVTAARLHGAKPFCATAAAPGFLKWAAGGEAAAWHLWTVTSLGCGRGCRAAGGRRPAWAVRLDGEKGALGLD